MLEYSPFDKIKDGHFLPAIEQRMRFNLAEIKLIKPSYYSCIWSAVPDADGVSWFEQHGGLERENGDQFCKQLLSRGGSE